MRTLTLASLSLLLAACASAPDGAQSSAPDAEDADTAFTELADEAWHYHRKQNAVTAANMGYEEYAGQLTDISPAALEERYEGRRNYYEQIQAIEPDELSADNQINRDMILYALRNSLSNYEYQMYLRPLTSESGPHNTLARLPNRIQFNNAEDYSNYLSLLEDIPQWLEQQMAYMEEGLATGMAQPAIVLGRMPDSIGAYIKLDPRDSVFYEPIEAAHRHLDEEALADLELEAQTVIATVVNPALSDFQEFMTDVYIPNAPEDIAATNLPQGEDFYDNRVRHYTTIDLSVEEIHQIGVSEVERIRAEMETIIEEVGFDGSFDEFIEFLRTDPQFYVDSGEELLRRASRIAKRADAVLPQLFYHLPRTPYGVEPVPDEIAPNYTQGRYVRPSRDDQPGYYWVNTYNVESRPLYELEALTLHEGVPGHHLQNAIAMEMDGLPDYRRNTYISAFGEGWGLYSEYLGIETGFYQDPYSDFGRLVYEMWRAVRLVVDTGMHAKGWTRDEAVDFLASNTALSIHNVNTEIDRYISWPGQALSYKLGELTIKRLRREAEETLGRDFDLRAFHDAILANGSIPLATLEEQMAAWVAEQQAAE